MNFDSAFENPAEALATRLERLFPRGVRREFAKDVVTWMGQPEFHCTNMSARQMSG
jgi:hypothetical protein